MLVGLQLRKASAVLDAYASAHALVCVGCGCQHPLDFARCPVCRDRRSRLVSRPRIRSASSGHDLDEVEALGLSRTTSFMHTPNSHFRQLPNEDGSVTRALRAICARNGESGTHPNERVAVRARKLLAAIDRGSL